MPSGFLDKLIDRIDRIDAGSLQAQFLHLARSKGLLETVFHALQEGIVLLDDRGRISYANRAAEKMLGFTLEEAEGAPIRRFLRDMDWDRILKLDEEEWSRLTSREIEVNYPDHRFLAFYFVPLHTADPKEKGAVVIFRDVTRERHSTVENIESERLRAITLLAAGVAHEIGNPLNSLTIHLQLLRRELARLADAEAREQLGQLVDVSAREVERLDGIISQFLRAVRPAPPQLESGHVEELLQDTLQFMRHEMADRNVLVECDIPDHVPTVRVDRGQMQQAFFNVIKNAFEAMPGGGVLRIAIGSDDRSVVVSFRDFGEGLTAEQLSAIFEPYYTTKPNGNGLGMMIVQRIVRDHGGELEINSEPGSGATFTFFLPREDRLVRLLRAHKQTEPPEPDGPGQARKRTPAS